MLKQEQVKTPELDKMLAVKMGSQKIGEFLEWLKEQGIVLARITEGVYEDVCGFDQDGLAAISQDQEQLLAEYYEIDLAKCERERQALLDAVREGNK